MNTIAAARSRHPSARMPYAIGGLRSRVEDALTASGMRHPEVAAAVLEARGVSGLDQTTFARRAGVEVAVLVAAEGGELGRSELPSGLRPMVPR